MSYATALRLAGAAASMLLALGLGNAALAQTGHEGHDMSAKDPHAGHKMGAEDPHAGHDMSGADPHAQHRLQAEKTSVKRSLQDITIAATPVVRQDGTKSTLAAELSGKKPVILAFIYTSCTTVCPVTSQIMARTQDLLGADLKNVRLVSISIDPEYDTPARLQEYAQRFGAQAQWQHYTGTLANSVAIQKAFNAYRGDKMNHVPLMFINSGTGKSWVRLEGFPAAEQVVKEYREQLKG